MHRLFLAFVLLATSISTTSLAGTVPLPSDVAVTLAATPTNSIRLGDSIAFTMTVSNNGPAPLGAFSIAGPQISSEFYSPNISWNDCNLVTITGDGANGPFWILEWNPTGAVGENPMAVDETRVCHFMLTIAPGFPSAYLFAVRLGTLWTDPNPNNNIATVLLQRAVDPIPALSLRMMVLLIGLLALTVRRLGQRRDTPKGGQNCRVGFSPPISLRTTKMVS